MRLLRTSGQGAAPKGLSRIIVDECRRLATAARERGIGSIEAARLRGLRPDDIARARRDGRIGVVASMRRGLFVPLLDRGEAERLSRDFVETTPLIRAAARFGCGRLGIEQLSAMGLLGPRGPIVPITGNEPRVCIAAMASLVAQLEALSTPLDGTTVTLVDAFRSRGGSPNPVGPAVLAILRGEIASQTDPGDGPVMQRIRIALEAVPRVRALFFDYERHPDHPFVETISKIEAGWELNLKSRHWVHLLSRWPTDGKLPVVPVAWLRETAAIGISVAEVAKRIGRHGKHVDARLVASGAREIMPFLYGRAEVEAAFGLLPAAPACDLAEIAPAR